MNRATAIAAIAFTALCAGCDSSPSSPSSSAEVTFAVAGERFRVSLFSEEQVAAARAAQAGGPRAHPYWTNRLWNAGQRWMELAPRGCPIRGEYDRAVRWQAIGRGTTGNQLRQRTLLSMGCVYSRDRLTVRSGRQTVDAGLGSGRGLVRSSSSERQ